MYHCKLQMASSRLAGFRAISLADRPLLNPLTKEATNNCWIVFDVSYLILL